MKLNFKVGFLMLCIMSASFASAQDILQIGINDDMISVTPPKLNQKVTVTIEDSLYNYQIEVMKLPKTIQTINTVMPEPEDVVVKTKKKFKSKFLDEIELGYATVSTSKHLSKFEHNPFSGATIDNLNNFFNPTGTYYTRGFIPNSNNGGVYFNLNLRNKTRQLWNVPNLYYRNTTQAKFMQSFYSGNMAFSQFISNDQNGADSLIKSDTFSTSVGQTNLFLVKRLAIGYTFNSQKRFSVEYGLDLGWRMMNREGISYNSGLAVIPADAQNFFPSVSIENPYLTFFHRLGVNYMDFSFNMGTSYGKRRIGSDQGYKGHMLNIGFAYRFR